MEEDSSTFQLACNGVTGWLRSARLFASTLLFPLPLQLPLFFQDRFFGNGQDRAECAVKALGGLEGVRGPFKWSRPARILALRSCTEIVAVKSIF